MPELTDEIRDAIARWVGLRQITEDFWYWWCAADGLRIPCEGWLNYPDQLDRHVGMILDRLEALGYNWHQHYRKDEGHWLQVSVWFNRTASLPDNEYILVDGAKMPTRNEAVIAAVAELAGKGE